MTYADFPACLPRYAWLLDQGDNAFDCAGRCKACGGDVTRPEREKHLRGHRAKLDAIRARTKAENAERLRAINRLRNETRSPSGTKRRGNGNATQRAKQHVDRVA